MNKHWRDFEPERWPGVWRLLRYRPIVILMNLDNYGPVDWAYYSFVVLPQPEEK
jgi:hypothetical protein